MTRSISELTQIIEGALFASNEPMSAEALTKIFIDETKPSLAQVRKCLAQLQENYCEKGIRLVEVATGYRFQVAQEVVPYVTKNMAEKPSRFSRAMLETLALIAYRQPITRGEIEEIRGVVASSNIIKTLEEFEWIRIVGYKEVPGKPGLYATTKTFLDHFGLKSLDELPPLAELRDLNNWPQEPIAVQSLEVPVEGDLIVDGNELVGPVMLSHENVDLVEDNNTVQMSDIGQALTQLEKETFVSEQIAAEFNEKIMEAAELAEEGLEAEDLVKRALSEDENLAQSFEPGSSSAALNKETVTDEA